MGPRFNVKNPFFFTHLSFSSLAQIFSLVKYGLTYGAPLGQAQALPSNISLTLKMLSMYITTISRQGISDKGFF